MKEKSDALAAGAGIRGNGEEKEVGEEWGKIKSAMNDNEASCVNCKHCKFSRENGFHYYCEKHDAWMTDEEAMTELDDIEYCEDYDEIEEGE